MSQKCLMIECKTCDFHVISGGKLGCNLANRLGLGKTELGTYLQPAGPETEDVVLDDEVSSEEKVDINPEGSEEKEKRE